MIRDRFGDVPKMSIELHPRTKKMTKKKKKRARGEIPAMRRLGSDLAHLGDSAGGKGGDGGAGQSDANTADEESRHRRKDYPHIHTPAKPHLLKQGSKRASDSVAFHSHVSIGTFHI